MGASIVLMALVAKPEPSTSAVGWARRLLLLPLPSAPGFEYALQEPPRPQALHRRSHLEAPRHAAKPRVGLLQDARAHPPLCAHVCSWRSYGSRGRGHTPR